MRRWVPVASGLAALVLLGTVDASAQTPAARQANIPFEFKVGAVVFPAGQYDVTYDGEAIPSVLVVRSRDGHHEALVLTETVDTKATKNARLIFEKEGG